MKFRNFSKQLLFIISTLSFVVSLNVNKSTQHEFNLDNFSNRFRFIKQNKLSQTVLNYNDSLCSQQLVEISEGLQARDDLAMELLDSWGKIPSGIFWGHLVQLGQFEECLNISRPQTKDKTYFKGQYCLAKVPLDNLVSGKKQDELGFNGRMDPATAGIDYSKLTLGICIPHTCDPVKFTDYIKDIIEKITGQSLKGVEINPNSCSTDEKIEFEAVDVFAIFFFTIVGFVMLISTVYDYLLQRSEETPKPIFVAFSVLTNGKKLFAIPNGKSADVVSCLNGIRCLSIMWVVFGHTYMMMSYMPHINAIKIQKWFSTPFSMLVQTGTISVDSFFFLSGFLLAWSAFKEMEKSKGKLNIFMMYFHRYIRLTPVVAVAILFYISLIKFMGSGPFWASFIGTTKRNCESNWWATLLYVNNYANSSKICLGHTWYLAVDTQLYILSPLILIPTWKWGKKFLLPVAGVLAFLSIACSFATFMKYNFSILITLPGGANASRRMSTIYYPTHTRYAPWLVGVVLGYLMFQSRKIQLKIPKKMILLGWLICFGLMSSIIYGVYPKTQPGVKATTLEGAFYESLSRVSWSIALSWIVFACAKGYGGVINSFLSYPFWAVFGRITYSIYIWHMIIETISSGSVKNDTHFSDFDSMFKWWGDFGTTTLISIVSVLAFESPIIGIEKAIFGSKTKVSKVEQANLGKHSDKNGSNGF